LYDARIEINSYLVEQAIPPLRSAVKIISSHEWRRRRRDAHRNMALPPQAYLRDVPNEDRRQGPPTSRIDEPLPFAYLPTQVENAAA
jgi:hypothetical protein